MVFVSASESNVEGAPSTPLVVEPQAGDPKAALIARLTQQHIASGRDPVQARRLAEQQVQSMGVEYAAGYSQRMEANPAFLEEAAREGKAADARHAQMQSDYNAATGLGPISPELQAQWEDSERRSAERSRVINAGLHPQQPADPGTPEQQARWEQFLESNPDEMQRYRPEEYAARQAAERAASDKSHAAMLDEKYGPGTGAKWSAARAEGRGVGTDVIPVLKATDQQIADRRAADARYTASVSRPRWAREAGLSQDAEETVKMSDGDLRLAAANARAADKQARELQWRAQLMMNRGNYAGALALPGIDDSMRSAILNQQNASLNANRAGGPINFGPTPLGVQALHNQQLTDLGLRVAQGRGFQQPTQEQRNMADVQARQAEEQLTPEAAADRERERNNGVLPANSSAGQRMLRQLDAEYIGFIASQSEIDSAVEAAVAAGVPEPEARAYFDRRKKDFLFWNPDPYGLRQPEEAG
jgi:hypothetical protein